MGFSSNDMYKGYTLQIKEFYLNYLKFAFKLILYHGDYLEELNIISIFFRSGRTVKLPFEIFIILSCPKLFQCRDRQCAVTFKEKRKEKEMFKSRVPRNVS